MTRVLHTGDTHIGYRQYHSPERRVDFLAAFRRVIEDAIESDVDAVVHAGDLFHDRRPPLADIHGTIEVLRKLDAADIPLFAVVGNHERTRGHQWLDLFETIGLATRLGRAPHIVGNVALYGLDFVPRSRREALDYAFEPAEASHAALVAHGLFEPFAHADWDTRAVLESATVDFDAMLLGDNHEPGVETVADTWVTYCGSTERVDAAERAERGYNLVTFDGGVTVARRGIETRPFVTIDLELAPGEGAERVRNRLAEESLDEAVVVVQLTGDGDPVSPADIETTAVEQGALVARVSDRRELASAEVEAVSFADPDQAVTERIRQRGLSDAALAIDDLVRDDTVPKTTVRDRVQSRVRDLLDSDAKAFETSEVATPTADTSTAAHEPSPGDTEDIESAEPPSPDRESVEAEDSASSSEAGDPEPSGGETTGAASAEASSAPKRQVTMEDYL